jgi:hypothetical protein
MTGFASHHPPSPFVRFDTRMDVSDGFQSKIFVALQAGLIADHSASCILSEQRHNRERENQENQCKDKKHILSHRSPPVNKYIHRYNLF